MVRLLIGIVFITFFALLSVSNTEQIKIWFVSFDWEIVTGELIFAIMLLSLVMGYILGWIGEFGQRRRARRAEAQTRSLEKEMVELHKRINQLQKDSTSVPPTPSSPSPRN